MWRKNIIIFISLFFSMSCGGPAIKPDSPVSSPIPQATKRTVRILAIDGGGIRGIIPAVILSEIEKRAQKPVSELFDLVVGTSTGGILALGLVKPNNQGRPQYTAKDLVAMYEKEGEQIFSRSIWQKIHSGGSLVGEKYPASGIEKVLEKYFDKARLKDALTEVLITSYDIERRIPFFFNSRNAKANVSYDFPMKQVARATSAAPTYFEPAKIDVDPSDYYALIDGGVFANNPALCGFVEAKSLHPESDDFLLVSVGTGKLTRRLLYDEVKDWGLARWAQPILNVVFDSVSDVVDYQMRELLPLNKDGVKRYYRFQAKLDKGNEEMDDANPSNIRVLKLLAEEMIRDNDEALTALCERLVN